jgi:hypothetical protein
MIFDKLCAISERFIPELVPALHMASVFQFAGKAADLLPESVAAKALETLHVGFELPAGTTAVERPGFCTLLMDSTPEQLGCGQRRLFVECMEVSREALAEMASKENRKYLSHDDVFSVRVGTLANYVFQGDTGIAKGVLSWWLMATKNEIVVPAQFLPADPAKFTEDEFAVNLNTLESVRVSLEELMYFTAPGRALVARSPLKLRPPPKGKVARSPDRTLYTTMRPDEAAKSFPTLRAESDEYVAAGNRYRVRTL